MCNRIYINTSDGFFYQSLNIATHFDHLSTMVAAVMLDYFLLELAVFIRHYKISGALFLIHATSSTYIAAIQLLPVLQP